MRNNPQMLIGQDPTIGRDEKKERIVKLIGPRVHSVTSRFFQVLAANGRLSDVEVVADSFNQLIDAERGIVQATVSTAQELSAGEQTMLNTVLNKLVKKVTHCDLRGL